MSDPAPDGPEPGGDDVAELTARLDAAEPGRVARGIGTLRRAVRALCALVAGTSLAALALGVAAWRDWPPGLAVALVGALPPVVAAAYVAHRVGPLTAAVTHPADVLDQARDLASRITASPELHRLVRRLRGRDRRPGRARRWRRALSTARSASAVVGLAGPDPRRHPLLVPFTPERLRRLWAAIGLGLWWWLAAWAVGWLAALTLLVQVA